MGRLSSAQYNHWRVQSCQLQAAHDCRVSPIPREADVSLNSFCLWLQPDPLLASARLTAHTWLTVMLPCETRPCNAGADRAALQGREKKAHAVRCMGSTSHVMEEYACPQSNKRDPAEGSYPGQRAHSPGRSLAPSACDVMSPQVQLQATHQRTMWARKDIILAGHL